MKKTLVFVFSLFLAWLLYVVLSGGSVQMNLNATLGHVKKAEQ